MLERPRRQHQQEKDGKPGVSRGNHFGQKKTGDQIGMQLQYSSLKRKNLEQPANLKPTLPMNNHLHFLGCARMRFPKRNQRPFEPQNAQFSTMLTREHAHKMHPVYQPSRPKNPKTKSPKVPGIEGKEPAFPTVPKEREAKGL